MNPRYQGQSKFEHGRTPRLGVVLVNLGTPESPTPAALRRYLAEFLSDPRVVEIPRLVWKAILHGVILRVRPKKSARAYASVWTDQGSSLRAESQALTLKVQAIAEELSLGEAQWEMAFQSRFGPAAGRRLARNQ